MRTDDEDRGTSATYSATSAAIVVLPLFFGALQSTSLGYGSVKIARRIRF